MPVTVLIGGGVGLHLAIETLASVLLWWVKEDRWGVHHPCREDRETFKSAGFIVRGRSVTR